MKEVTKKQKKILDWLEMCFYGKYTVEFTADDEIIIFGNVRFVDYEATELKYPFSVVHGDFNIGGDIFAGEGMVPYRSLTTLKNCPKIVDGSFYCCGNPHLTSLVGGPEKVGNIYRCNHCDLENLNGIAKEIGSWITAFGNRRLRDISALTGVEIHKTCDFEFASPELTNDPLYQKLLHQDKIINPVSIYNKE